LGVDEPPFPPLLKWSPTAQGGVESWDEYGQREQTRREHLVELQTVFGFQPFTMSHYRQAVQWLTELALQTDKGIVLASALIEHLRRQSIILPASTPSSARAPRPSPAPTGASTKPWPNRCRTRTAIASTICSSAGQRQDDLAGLAAPVARQAELAPHARTHRTPQSLAGARPAFRHRAARFTRTACSRSPARVAR
jgi:hypothetical protein